MGVTRTEDGNIELIIITDDAGADFSHTITFTTPVEIVRIKMQKPAAGTLVASSVTDGGTGPTTVIGSATLAAADTEYYSNDSNLLHTVGLESMTVVSVGTGAGTKVSISAQNLLSEEGRDF
jgi:hypothetical protein